MADYTNQNCDVPQSDEVDNQNPHIFEWLHHIHRDLWFYLTAQEYRVLMFIFMRTIAWNKESESISEQHFLKGVHIQDILGRRVIQPVPGSYKMLPMSKSSLYRVLNSLEEKGIINRRKTSGATVYTLIGKETNTGESLHLKVFGSGLNSDKREKLIQKAKLMNEEHFSESTEQVGIYQQCNFLQRTEGGASVGLTVERIGPIDCWSAAICDYDLGEISEHGFINAINIRERQVDAPKAFGKDKPGNSRRLKRRKRLVKHKP